MISGQMMSFAISPIASLVKASDNACCGGLSSRGVHLTHVRGTFLFVIIVVSGRVMIVAMMCGMMQLMILADPGYSAGIRSGHVWGVVCWRRRSGGEESGKNCSSVVFLFCGGI